MPRETGKLTLAKMVLKQLSVQSFFDQEEEPTRRHRKRDRKRKMRLKTHQETQRITVSVQQVNHALHACGGRSALPGPAHI